MDDTEFLKAFEAGTIPAEAWHHREHVKIAYLYLNRYSFDEALGRMRAGLEALNAAQKVPDAPDRGYHETMTCAWLRLVHCALCENGSTATADAFIEQHSHLQARRALYFFYSRDRLMSAAAKKGFVEPDLAPLPKSPKAFDIVANLTHKQ